jgi:hypothetical protein
LVLSSCSSSGGGPTAQSISITTSNLSIAKGLTTQFKATVTFSDGTTKDLTGSVTWSSSNTGVATITTGGLATGVGVGSATIQAAINGVTHAVTLQVTAAVLQSIAVTPANPSIAKGAKQQFTATGTLTDDSTQNLSAQVTWSSVTQGVATITAGGQAAGVNVGTSSIQASLNGIMGSTVLTVTVPVLQSIAVTPANPSIAKGLKQQFTATGTFTDNSTQNLTAQVTWSSLNPTFATITAGGLATGINTGTATIQAALSGIAGSTVLTVTAPVLQSIAVTPANPSIAEGTSQQFTATGTFSDNSTQNLTAQATWSSVTPFVATITAGALATGVNNGTSSIQASLSGITGSAVLTVTNEVLQSIAVTPVNPSIAKGLKQQFTATGTFSDNSTQDLTSQVTWNSVTTTVATITASGLGTGVNTGTSTIQASMSGITGSTVLTVTAAVLQSIAVTPANPSITKGLTQQFTATGTFTDNSTQNLTSQVTWSSVTTAVATITADGLATGVNIGTSSIQATLSGVTGSTLLTVTSAASLAVLVVSPQNPVIADSGATQAFTATGHFSDGSTQDLTASATWSSTNASVATTSGGVATSQTLGAEITAGFTTIQAAVGGISGAAILSVTKQGGNGFAGVFTQHNDISRTGLNANETVLTPANVSGGTFRKKFAMAVDAAIYAQPLYVPNVSIGGGTRNVIYVVTEGDSAYAFDADTGAQYWHANMIDTAHGAGAGATVVSSGDVGCGDLQPNIGITATPVIDPSTGTMYVETKSKESGNFFHRLHAIDITTGNEKPGAPTRITGTVPKPGGGTITFNDLRHMNRPGLLWLNGMIYVAYASLCDNTPYFGWVFAYDAATLGQRAVWNSAPTSDTVNGGLAGVWMSGSGLAADSAGNIFLATGNGLFDTTNIPATQLGDSEVKLFFNGTTTLSLLDYFTPFNQQALSNRDTDLGSGGVLLLPDQPGSHPHEFVQLGKDGTIRLLDRDQMTSGNLHYCASNCNNQDAQIVQEIVAGLNGVWSVPAHWNGNVYIGPISSFIKMYTLNGSGMFNTSVANQTSHNFGYPGTVPSISANGTSNAILWAVDTANYGSNGTSVLAAVLYAYDATTLNELYNSSNVVGDAAGGAVKFAVTTVANGRVYIGTNTEVDVYGP